METTTLTIAKAAQDLDGSPLLVDDQILYTLQVTNTGDYTAFVAGKQAERERKEKELNKREKEFAHHQQFVDRFRAKATKARQAQSKLRLIEKRQSEPEPLAQSSRRYPTFRFPQRRPSGKEALRIEGISKAYGDNQVLNDVSLTVRRGQRLAILGPNGIGKSTLLKIAMERLDADGGTVEWGHETYPGYFAQDFRELLLEERQTVEEFLWAVCPAEPIGFVRGQLAQMLFSKDEVNKRLANLSGGEGARLLFAKLAVEKPNVLILDEPTNHLDLEAIEALVAGLQEYEYPALPFPPEPEPAIGAVPVTQSIVESGPASAVGAATSSVTVTVSIASQPFATSVTVTVKIPVDEVVGVADDGSLTRPAGAHE